MLVVIMSENSRGNDKKHYVNNNLGQAIPAFDFYMAPYVKLTFKEEIDNACTLFDIKDRGEHSWMYNSPDEYEYKDLGETEGRERAYRHAINQTVRRVYQAMESFVHNLNTMHSRGGNQVVFSSINYGTDTSAEGRCIMRELLKVTLQGVGNNQTALFPIQIWKVKEGVNYNPEDKNYDLYKFACEVSSKRYFPNFLNLDATYNKDENWNATDPLRYMHEVATMGAARGDETVSIKINDSEYYNIPISSAYELLKKAIRSFNCEDRKSDKLSQFRRLDGVPCVYKITHIPTGQYYIGSTKNFYGRLLEHRYSCRHRGTIGDLFFINDYDANNLEFTILEENVSPDILLDLEDKYIDLSDPLCVNQKSPLNNGNYDKDKFQGIMHRKLQGKDKRYGNYVQKYRTLVHKVPNNKEVYILSNNQWTPIRALMYNDNCMILNMFEVTFDKNGKTQTLHITEDHPLHTKRGRVRADELVSGDIIFDSITKEEYTITSVVPTDEDCPTYDFEVDNDCFDLSGIISHNCRTRVFENRFGPKTSVGRGNLSFTTINLPRLGILAMQEFPDDETKRVEYFFELLHDMCDKTAKQLEDRFQFQKTAFKRQFPFMMNYLWIDGNTLSDDDRVDSVINQGTLGIGFIGLAECLIALTGKHHGESMESQQLGLKIIGYMRSLANDYSEQYHHNYSVIGTPAEGLAGRFTKLDKKKFGIIPGITNKDFYTNSSHVPVYYHISPSQKAAIECPYHEMERGGHIFYVEMDSVVGNPEAIMRVVDIARSYNGGYISINYNSNTCLSCGHQWIGRDQVCPVCGSDCISTLQRITGYLVGETSKWNDGKLAELKARVEHKL